MKDRFLIYLSIFPHWNRCADAIRNQWLIQQQYLISLCVIMLDCFHDVINQITFLFLLLLTLYTPSTSQVKINPAMLPTIYMPEKLDHMTVNGFTQGMIVSQQGLRYSSNIDSTLTVQVRQKYGLMIAFEHLDLVEDIYGTQCDDFIQFYAGHNKELILTRPFCGKKPPSSHLLTNFTTVTIRFRTNHFRESSGFRLKFDRIPIKNISDCDRSGLCQSADYTDTRSVSRTRNSTSKSGVPCLSSSRCSLVVYAAVVLLSFYHEQICAKFLTLGPQNR